MTQPTKLCLVCGRVIGWRRRWANDWEQVKYCSQSCRRRGLRPMDARIEAEILRLLEARAALATACPSEIARRLGGEGWREWMEPVRMASRRLVAGGRLEILQKGRVVDPSTARGPIRLRLSRRA
jgi:hypothetical protein